MIAELKPRGGIYFTKTEILISVTVQIFHSGGPNISGKTNMGGWGDSIKHRFTSKLVSIEEYVMVMCLHILICNHAR